MGLFTQIPIDAFQALQMDAGVIATSFNPEAPGSFSVEHVLCATTGGITVSCTPEYSDLAEDVDNAPNNVKEFKHLDSWECKFSTTTLGTSANLIKLALGAADIDGNKITPRKNLVNSGSNDDFNDLWWIGDRADGGFVACKIKNALSTGGFSLKTTKNGKGTIDIELTGHVSINEQNVMPMEFYVSGATESVYTVEFDVGGTDPYETQTVPSGGLVTEPELNPTKSGYTFGGWFADDEYTDNWNFRTRVVRADTTIYARWDEVTP